MTDPIKTPLHAMHLAAGARMEPFVGYDMPLRYPQGSVAEHNQARNLAALFDVSHMGQLRLMGEGADAALETLVPGDIQGLGDGAMRYTLFTLENGGILDDLIVSRVPGGLGLVVNAARRRHDTEHLRSHLGGGVDIVPEPDRALLALQGPAAAAVLPEFADLPFMAWRKGEACGVPARVSRSGYTGRGRFRAVGRRRRRRSARRAACSPMKPSPGPGSMRATRSGWKPASASTGGTSTRIRRRWKPASAGRCRSAGARSATSPARRASSTILPSGAAPA